MSPWLNLEVVPLSEVPFGSPVPKPEESRHVVLVVDDERVIADTLSIILTKNGFSVLTAYNAAAALELASVVKPELLLSDVMMGPGLDGTELAIELVKDYPDCKILLFSGHAATRDLLDKARTGGYNFTLLTKPLHPADLLAKISESFAQGAPASRAASHRPGATLHA